MLCGALPAEHKTGRPVRRLLEQPRREDGEVIGFRIRFPGRELANRLDVVLHKGQKSAMPPRCLARANHVEDGAIYRARKS